MIGYKAYTIYGSQTTRLSYDFLVFFMHYNGTTQRRTAQYSPIHYKTHINTKHYTVLNKVIQ